MKIFICWSGDWGRTAAEQIREWLDKDVFKDAPQKPTVLVSGNIAKGAVWFEELSGFLDKAAAALVCLTRDALQSPWVHYEVGAVTRALREKRKGKNQDTRPAPIFTLLFGVKPGEISGPLAAFQSTSTDDSKDTRRLVNDLNLVLSSGQQSIKQLPAAQDDKWPATWEQLRKGIMSIAVPSLVQVFPDLDRLFRRKTFQEPTRDCVNQRWQERYDGARDTWAKLRERESTVEQTCRPYVVDMYKALVATVDQYAMATSLLVGTRRFDIDTDGRVMIDPSGIAEACERSRRTIKSLVARLTDLSLAPRFQEAFRFEVAESVSEKKSFIHHRAPDVKKEEATILDVKNEHWQTSDWDYDRIIYSQCLEKRVKTSGDEVRKRVLDVALDHAMKDLERARAREGPDALSDGSHLMSLGYALAPFERAPQGTSLGRQDELRDLVMSIRELLRRGHSARGGTGDRSTAKTFESLEAVLEDSLKSIEHVFGLSQEGDAPSADAGDS